MIQFFFFFNFSRSELQFKMSPRVNNGSCLVFEIPVKDGGTRPISSLSPGAYVAVLLNLRV